MSVLTQPIESVRQDISPAESFAVTRQHEVGLSRMLRAHLSVGLAFMLLPGTFLGVLNLFSLSGHSHPSASWMQAHGHAQIFGWVATFILGIGFYSIPKLRGAGNIELSKPWAALALWSAGVSLRWITNVYEWHWRELSPLSATLELAAFLIFFMSVSGHKSERPPDGKKPRMAAWTLVVMVGTIAFLAATVANVCGTIVTSLHEPSPAFAHAFDQKFLVLLAWGFLAITVLGFAARWIPTFIGLPAPRDRFLLAATLLNILGVTCAWFALFRTASVLIFAAAVIACFSLRIFERAVQAAKTNGVHASLPVFLRSTFGWLIVAASLGIWAAFDGDKSGGLGGASRHALTVGFVSLMIFGVGQRVLPAFSGMKLLFSKTVMFWSMLLASVGCTLRVVSEVLAYPEYVPAAWHVLPVSAVIELTGFTLFAINLFVSVTRAQESTPAKLYSISAKNSSSSFA